MKNFPLLLNVVGEDGINIKKSIEKWVTNVIIQNRTKIRGDSNKYREIMEQLSVELDIYQLFFYTENEELVSSESFSKFLSLIYEEVAVGNLGISFLSGLNVIAIDTIINLQNKNLLNKEISCVIEVINYEKSKNISLILPDIIEKEGEYDSSYIPLNSGCDSDIIFLFTERDKRKFLFIGDRDKLSVNLGSNIKNTGMIINNNCVLELRDIKFNDNDFIEVSDEIYGDFISKLYLLSAAVSTGALLGAYKILYDWVNNRVIKDGRLIKKNGLVQKILGDIAVNITTSRVLLYNFADALDTPENYSLKTLNEKVNFYKSNYIKIMDMSFESVDRAIELMASAGYAKEWDIEEYWRDTRTLRSVMGGVVGDVITISKEYF